MSEAPATTSVPSATPGGIATCRQSIARNSKSFALASRLLPGHTADHAAIVYAWCRRAARSSTPSTWHIINPTTPATRWQ